MTKGGAGEERPIESIASLPSSVSSKTWKVPFLPPSMNKLYGINFQKRSVYMMPEARDWKTKAKMCIGNFPITGNDKLSFSLNVYTNWYYKNNNLKKSDIQNLIKVVVDAVSERLSFDDSQVFSFSAVKHQSTENYCTITLEKQNEEISNVEKA
jgi:Holliday junction resolvase RusA-like endonuclease